MYDAASDIERLIENAVSESDRLEFKGVPYGTNDREKREFLKDFSALANTFGGHLIIGLEEDENGAAKSICPFEERSPDLEIQRLENLVRDNLDPRVFGHSMREVSFGKGHLIVIEVPRSSSAPHRVTHKGSNRFYKRNSRGVHEMSLSELKNSFLTNATLAETLHNFVEERSNEIMEKYRSSYSEGTLILHAAALGTMAAGQDLDVVKQKEKCRTFVPMYSSHSTSLRVNLDGVLVGSSPNNELGYVQVYRDGKVEATMTKLVTQTDGIRKLNHPRVAHAVTKFIPEYLNRLTGLGAIGPFFVSVRLRRVGNSHLANGRFWTQEDSEKFEKEAIDLGHFITEYPNETEAGLKRNLAEMIHLLWNAYGYDNCPFFDDEYNLNQPD